MYRNDREVELPLMRVLTGIRNFGYTFQAAIFDIMDNSIVAGAKRISVFIEAEEVATKNMKKIIIVDDGCGMNLDEMYNALFLGSPTSNYDDNSLSKYGFGLKSAGLSLANTVAVISRKNRNENWKKSVISWNKFEQMNQYVVDEDVEIGEEEKYLENLGEGTIVILEDLLNINRINADKAHVMLKKGAGITFHRFIEEDKLVISINKDEVEAADPLFCELSGNEFSKYNGREPVSFWKKDCIIPINAEKKAKAVVKAILLPCPPVYEKEGRKTEINKKYGLTKQNIGFYIYRNRRLIKQGVTLGLITRRQETYPVRIRIDLDSRCDSFINLDVKKTELYFTDDFLEKLSERVMPFINRAVELWPEVQKKGGEENKTVSDLLHDRSNKLLEKISPVDCDPQTLEIKQVQKEIETKIEQFKKEYPTEKNIIDEIRKRNGKRVIAVDDLENGMLWKPSIGDDDSNKVIVLLSRAHPFYTKIYQKLVPGSDAVVVLDALFLNMAMAEMGISSLDVSKLAKIFKRLRQSVSYQLSNFIDLEIESDEETGVDEAD